jgi:hypothetical protein
VVLNLVSTLSGSGYMSLRESLYNFQLRADEDKARVELYLHAILRHGMVFN